MVERMVFRCNMRIINLIALITTIASNGSIMFFTDFEKEQQKEYCLVNSQPFSFLFKIKLSSTI